VLPSLGDAYVCGIEVLLHWMQCRAFDAAAKINSWGASATCLLEEITNYELQITKTSCKARVDLLMS
jgi:hypothetical protein